MRRLAGGGHLALNEEGKYDIAPLISDSPEAGVMKTPVVNPDILSRIDHL